MFIPGAFSSRIRRKKVNKNTLINRFLFMKTFAERVLYRKMSVKAGIYKQK